MFLYIVLGILIVILLAMIIRTSSIIPPVVDNDSFKIDLQPSKPEPEPEPAPSSLQEDTLTYQGGSRKQIYDPFLRHLALHEYRFDNIEHLTVTEKDNFYLPPGDLDDYVKQIEEAPYNGDTELKPSPIVMEIDKRSSDGSDETTGTS